MTPYWFNCGGRYGTGESYDWMPKYEKFENEMETFESPDGIWTCTEVDGGIEILRYDADDTSIIVPSEINGKRVVSLSSTFEGFLELKSVVVPDGVISIEGAFYGCEGLERVVLPESLVDMDWAFNCCYSLKEIDIPSGVKNVSYAFQYTGLRQIEFPQGTEDISYVFADSQSLEYVYIPKTVTNMNEAFSDCENLKKVVIENGIKRIDGWAFYNCTGLYELTIPESVVEIGEKSVGIMEIREYTDSRKTGYRIKGWQVVPGFKIIGKRGSEAERYAKENGITFVAT